MAYRSPHCIVVPFKQPQLSLCQLLPNTSILNLPHPRYSTSSTASSTKFFS